MTIWGHLQGVLEIGSSSCHLRCGQTPLGCSRWRCPSPWSRLASNPGGSHRTAANKWIVDIKIIKRIKIHDMGVWCVMVCILYCWKHLGNMLETCGNHVETMSPEAVKAGCHLQSLSITATESAAISAIDNRQRSQCDPGSKKGCILR